MLIISVPKINLKFSHSNYVHYRQKSKEVARVALRCPYLHIFTEDSSGSISQGILKAGTRVPCDSVRYSGSHVPYLIRGVPVSSQPSFPIE